MNTEKFFRDSGGKLTFNAIESIGMNNSVDCTEIHQRVSQHFYAGDGWPVGTPVAIDPQAVWTSFGAH